MPQVLIIGGTKGLGLEIGRIAAGRRLETIITGRSAPKEPQHPLLTYKPFDVTKTDNDRNFSRIFNEAIDRELSSVFIVAGSYLHKPLAACSRREILNEFATNALGPIEFLRCFHHMRTSQKAPPYRLVIVSSTAAFRMQYQASAHAASKGAISQFTRQFAGELTGDLPGSMTLLVHPGRMQSGTHPPGTDLSKLMDPSAVASLIWKAIDQQTPEEPYLELRVFREQDGVPRAEYGPQLVETL